MERFYFVDIVTMGFIYTLLTHPSSLTWTCWVSFVV